MATGMVHRGTMQGKLKGVMAATTPKGERQGTLSTPLATSRPVSGVAGAYGHGDGPQGHHAREVEGGYGGHDTQGVAPGDVVHAPGYVAHGLRRCRRLWPRGWSTGAPCKGS